MCQAFNYLLLIYVFGLPLAHSENTIDWVGLMPNSCVSDLNFSLPNQPIALDVAVRVHSIYDISEERMEFVMQVDLFMAWEGPFEFSNSGTGREKNIYVISIPQQIVDCIWKPDIVFSNAKTVQLYTEPTINRFYKLKFPERLILNKSRYKVVVSCSMQFQYYPMDSQNCSLDISLYSSVRREVTLNWIHEKYNFSVAIDETPLNYAIIPLPNTKTQREIKEAKIVVEYLHANYLFERSLSASLFNTYIPSFLVVCLSMISFWLDVEAVPGRVTLGVTAILTLSTQIVQARSSLPVLDYMTAMDVWLLGCLVMVFASLIEFTLANAFARKLKNSRIYNVTSENSNLFGNDAWMESDSSKRLALNCRRFKSGVVKKTVMKKLVSCKVSKDNLLDRISRICFPIVALGLGGFYWFYFYNKAYP